MSVERIVWRCEKQPPVNVSWYVVLDQVVQFVVIQEGSSHVPAQLHV